MRYMPCSERGTILTEFSIIRWLTSILFVVVGCFCCFFFQAYFRRAEALKNAIKKGEVDVKRPGSLTHLDSLSDYRKSYKLKRDMKVLVEGVLFATEYGKS